MNNGSVTPTASHFNQVRYSGNKHSGQSGPPILFAPPRAAHQHKNPPPQALQPERRGIAVLIQQPLKSIADVRHKSHMTSALDSNGQLALMESASAGDAAGNDFGTLADVFAQAGQILVINAVDAINAEAANLFAAAMHRTRRTIHSHDPVTSL
jgi:hypothetical protein